MVLEPVFVPFWLSGALIITALVYATAPTLPAPVMLLIVLLVLAALLFGGARLTRGRVP
ncbi:MAG TPA: hypothetical protein VJ400_05265 [Thermoplasmata archaeon]|nr:hypothetical protein [Thermoplasmata archaeon]